MKKSGIVMFLLLPLILTGCGNKPSDDHAGGSASVGSMATVPTEYAGKTNPLGADASAAGGEIFRDNCVPCHGQRGHGDGPTSESLSPRPANLAELQSRVDDDYLFWRISTGKDGTAMVAWKGVLSDEQIWQVVAFIRTLK